MQHAFDFSPSRFSGAPNREENRKNKKRGGGKCGGEIKRLMVGYNGAAHIFSILLHIYFVYLKNTARLYYYYYHIAILSHSPL
jgi:hypothetical protein